MRSPILVRSSARQLIRKLARLIRFSKLRTRTQNRNRWWLCSVWSERSSLLALEFRRLDFRLKIAFGRLSTFLQIQCRRLLAIKDSGSRRARSFDSELALESVWIGCSSCRFFNIFYFFNCTYFYLIYIYSLSLLNFSCCFVYYLFM